MARTKLPPQHMAMAEAEQPRLLVVPMEVQSNTREAVVDTGSTYTLMQNSLWQRLARPGEKMGQGDDRPFVLADGKSHTAMGMVKLSYVWQGSVWPVDTYIMDDGHLAFPLILGLNFMVMTGVQINVAGMDSRFKGDGHMSLFLTGDLDRCRWTSAGTSCLPRSTCMWLCPPLL